MPQENNLTSADSLPTVSDAMASDTYNPYQGGEEAAPPAQAPATQPAPIGRKNNVKYDKASDIVDHISKEEDDAFFNQIKDEFKSFAPTENPPEVKQTEDIWTKIGGYLSTAWGVAKDIPGGIGKGYEQLQRNLANNAYELIEGKPSKQRVEYEKAYGEQDSIATRMAGTAVEIGTPSVLMGAAGFALGGPPGAAIGMYVGATVGNVMMDPHDESLSNMLQDTRAKDWPVIGDIINATAHKPGDTNLEGRLKNFYEGLTLDAVMWGTGKVIAKTGIVDAAKNGYKRLIGKKVVENTPKAEAVIIRDSLNKVANPDAPGAADRVILENPNDPVEVIQYVDSRLKEENKKFATELLRNEYKQYKAGTPEAEQLLLTDIDNTKADFIGADPDLSAKFEKDFNRVYPDSAVGEEAPRKAKTTSEFLNSADGDLVDAIVSKHEEVKERYKLRPKRPKGIQEVIAQKARDQVDNDPEYVKKLINTPAEKISDEQDMAALQYMMIRLHEDALNKMERIALGKGTDAELIAATDALSKSFFMTDKYLDSGTNIGRVLSIRQLLGRYAAAGNEAAQKFISAEGKARAIQELIVSRGGREAIQEQAEVYSKILKEAMQSYDMYKRKDPGFKNLAPELQTLAKQYGKISESTYKDYRMLANGEIMAKSVGRKIIDGAISLRFHNMVNHGSTVLSSIFSSPYDMAFYNTKNFIKAGLSLAIDRKNFKQDALFAVNYAEYMMKNMVPAAKMGWKQLLGQEITDKNTMFLRTSQAKDVVQEVLKEVQSTTLDRTAKAYILKGLGIGYEVGVRGGTRMLSSWDTFVGEIGYNARLMAEYRTQGQLKGLTGDALEAFVDQGVRMPDEMLHREAMKDAAKFAYRADLENPILKRIEELSRHSDVMKLIFPFFRAYGNTLERVAEYFPLNPMNFTSTEGAAKSLTGASALLISTYLHRTGVIDTPILDSVAAHGTQEPGKNGYAAGTGTAGFVSTRNADGTYQRMKIGGMAEKYMRMGALLNVAVNYVGPEEYDTMFKGALYAIGNTMAVDDQFRTMQSVLDIISAANDNTDNAKAAARVGMDVLETMVPAYRMTRDFNSSENQLSSRLTWGVDIDNKLGYVETTGDAVDYVYKTIYNRIRNVVPGMGGPPAFNFLGEILPTKPGRYVGDFFTPTEKSSRLMSNLVTMADIGHVRKSSGEDMELFDVEPMQNYIELDKATGEIPGLFGLQTKGNIRVDLSPYLYAKMNLYVSNEGDYKIRPAYPTLREAITQVFKDPKHEGALKPGGDILRYNSLVAEIKNTIKTYRSEAMNAIKKDPEVQEVAIKKARERRDLQIKNVLPNIFRSLEE